MGTTGVDVGAVRAVAREYETAAQIVDAAVRIHLGALAFGSATAGRDYAGHGEAVHGALTGLAGSLRQWSRAAGEIAAALRASADRYQDADARAAERVG
ncbi:type VII secretion target [Mycolicibacterium sp.]|uniref:type VII secretion target n=1 Tax=Mycolicibacterium sp. TaxID=2320850 RepID=UPI003D129EFD